jgi:hypothetical protein
MADNEAEKVDEGLIVRVRQEDLSKILVPPTKEPRGRAPGFSGPEQGWPPALGVIVPSL